MSQNQNRISSRFSSQNSSQFFFYWIATLTPRGRSRGRGWRGCSAGSGTPRFPGPVVLSCLWVHFLPLWMLCAELIGNLKLGNVLVFVQLIHRPTRTKISCTEKNKPLLTWEFLSAVLCANPENDKTKSNQANMPLTTIINHQHPFASSLIFYNFASHPLKLTMNE